MHNDRLICHSRGVCRGGRIDEILLEGVHKKRWGTPGKYKGKRATLS